MQVVCYVDRVYDNVYIFVVYEKLAQSVFPQLLIIIDLSTETSFLTEMTILLVGKALYLQPEFERKNIV